MVAVSLPPAGLRLALAGFDYNKAIPAPDYYIDRHEVTNAEFKAFVDAGGYESNGVLDRALHASFRRSTGPRQWPSSATCRTPWTGDLAGRHLPRPGGLAGNRSELVEAAAYRIPRKALADDLSLVVCGEARAGQCDHALESLWRRRVRARGHRARSRGVRDRRHGRQRQGVGLERADRAGKRYILGGAWNDPDYQFLYSDAGRPSTAPTPTGFAAWSTAPARRQLPPSPLRSWCQPMTSPPGSRSPTPCIGSTRTGLATIARPSTCA